MRQNSEIWLQFTMWLWFGVIWYSLVEIVKFGQNCETWSNLQDFWQNSEIWLKFPIWLWFGMVWYSLVEIVKLNSKP